MKSDGAAQMGVPVDGDHPHQRCLVLLLLLKNQSRERLKLDVAKTNRHRRQYHDCVVDVHVRVQLLAKDSNLFAVA
jgi:hypothetical protein